MSTEIPADAVLVDTDGDGAVDAALTDVDGDGTTDAILDTDGDGQADSIAYDTDADGEIDVIEADTDADGDLVERGVLGPRALRRAPAGQKGRESWASDGNERTLGRR